MLKAGALPHEPSPRSASLPVFTHITLGTYVECREVFIPNLSRAHPVTPCLPRSLRDHQSANLQSLHVHTHTHTQRRMATGPDGDQVLVLGFRRLILPPHFTKSLMPTSLILYVASITSDPRCPACSDAPGVSADLCGIPVMHWRSQQLLMHYWHISERTFMSPTWLSALLSGR